MNRLALCAAVLLAVPSALAAQTTETAGLDRLWSVNVRGGAQLYPEASALETGAVAGVEVLYHITPRFAVGPAADYVHTRTDGRFFISLIELGPDSARVFQVGQRVSAAHYGVNLLGHIMPTRRLEAYLAGGVGGYTLFLGAQANAAPRREGGFMIQGGGGIRFGLSESTALELDARDIVYTGFERETLNPIRQDQRLPRPDGSVPPEYVNLVPSVPGPEETLHNIRLTIGFSYIPNRNR